MNLIKISQLKASTPRPVIVIYKGLKFIVCDSDKWSTYKVCKLDGSCVQHYESIADVKNWIQVLHDADAEESERFLMELKAEQKGITLLDSKPTQHVGDGFYIVLATNDKNEFVTSLWANDGFHHGHYFGQVSWSNRQAAKTDFNNRNQ